MICEGDFHGGVKMIQLKLLSEFKILLDLIEKFQVVLKISNMQTEFPRSGINTHIFTISS